MTVRRQSRQQSIAWVTKAQKDAEPFLIRTEAGLSLAEMGRAVGVSASAIYHYETGRRLPRPDIAVRWARVLRQLQATLRGEDG